MWALIGCIAEYGSVACRAESLFAAYYFFTRKGYEVTLASVKGGKLPIDPKSVQSPFLSTIVKKGLTDGTVCHCPACDTVSCDSLDCLLSITVALKTFAVFNMQWCHVCRLHVHTVSNVAVFMPAMLTVINVQLMCATQADHSFAAAQTTSWPE